MQKKNINRNLPKHRKNFKIIETSNSAVYIKKIEVGKMARLLVLSEGKKEKEESMDKLKEKRMLKDLSKLRQSIENRKIILIGKISQRLGRIMERYPSVAKYYEIDLIPDVTGKEASGITWSKKALRDERSVLTGCYVIETTHQELNALEIFEIYHTLTQVEYAFRCLKTIENRKIILIGKISQRLGRIMERYPSVAKYYEIDLIPDVTGKEASGITWSKKALRDERSVLTGCYVIETTHQELNALEIFEIYHTLTQVEYAFRCLKTDLGVRLIHHQLARRTKGHLFISVLAYHLLIAIETSLKEQEDTRKWSTIKKT